MLTVKEHKQEIEGLVGVIQQKDTEITDLRSRLDDMQESLKHLLNDLRKSKIDLILTSNVYS